ncbi:MAG TPA: OmpA family protein [Kofleriaceae bacterium]|jgi:peptidoglycan-associated lipoprotein
MKRLFVVIAASSLAACSHSKPHPVSVATAAPPAAKPPQPAAVAVSPSLSVSQELARACALDFNATPKTPKFGFDRFQLLPADRNVLDQVATCITTGPLRGRALKLVGRADPRGTEEYNLGLGTRRASSVRDYLEHLGVADQQLTETTRGALDATGTDDAGWAVDRRVDLELRAS